MLQIGKLTFLTFGLYALLVPSALADLVGAPAAPPAISAAEQAMLSRNPDLTDLSLAEPWLIRSILANLGGLPRDASLPSVDFNGLGAYEIKLLGRNPDLLNVWQASPEAAAELLALIKAAGGKQGKGLDF